MKTSALFVLAAGLLLTSCSKKEADAVQPTNQAASGNPLTAPVDYLGAIAKAKKHSEKTIDATSVDQAVQLFYAQEDRFPKDLNELVSKHYIPAIPPAPTGLQWSYNPKTGETKLLAAQ